MTGLILRNPALRGLAKPLALCILVATLAGNLVAFFSTAENGSGLDARWVNLLGQLALLAPLVFVLYLGQPGQRARRTEMGWPLPAVDLWIAHFVALMSAIGGLLVISTAALVAVGHLLPDLTDRSQPGLLAGLQLALRPGAVSFMAVALLVGWRPSLAQPEHAAGWSRRRLLITAFALLSLVVLTWLPASVAIVPLLAAAMYLVRARKQVGPALELVGSDKEGDQISDHRVGADAWVALPPARRTVHSLIVRSVLKCPSYVIFLMLLLGVIGVALSGLFTRGRGSGLVLTNFFLVVYILASPLGQFIKGLHKLDHMPISRRLLLAWLVLPAVGSLVVGYGVSHLVQSFGKDRGELILFVNETEGYGLKLPPSHFEPDWQLDSPEVTAPWGETQPSTSWRVWPGVPLHLVKPYATPVSSSREFVAWQISRAAAAVYGTEINPDEIAERYLVTDEAGRTQVAASGLTLQQDYPALRTVSDGPVFIVLIGSHLLALGLVMWAFFAAAESRFWRRRTKTLFAVTMVVLMAAHIGVAVGLMTETYNDEIVFGLAQGQIRSLGAGGGFAWLMTGGVMALGLWLIARRVDRVFAALESPRA